MDDTRVSLPGYTTATEEILDWMELLRHLALLELEQPLPAGAAPKEAFFAMKQRAKTAEVALPLHVLATQFFLSDFSLFCIMLASTPGFDLSFEAVYRSLGAGNRPTLSMAMRFFSHIGPVDGEELAEVLNPQSPCRVAFTLAGETPHMGQSLVPAASLHAVLRGDIPPFSQFSGLRWHLPEQPPPPHHNAELALRIAQFVQLGEENGDSCTALVTGPRGCGRSQTLCEAARLIHMPLAVVDAQSLCQLPAEAQETIGWDVLLWAAALNGRVAVTGLSPNFSENTGLANFLSRCSRLLTSLFLVAEDGVPDWLPLTENLVEFPFAPSGLLARRALWQQAAAAYSMEESVDVGQFANKLCHTAEDVRRILHRAHLHARSRNNSQISGADIWAGVRLHNASQPEGRSLSRVECLFTWNDIVLPEEQIRQMRAACNRILHAHTVNEQWGFGKKLPYGRGVSVLLYGPPGTGKTMSAQVMAGELGLDLYKVDLSQLVSKYIGETEKNVSDIFSFARRTNCVLLFDEADSLFSKRTEVKDSNDRHANTETAFLLQKIEEHAGFSILSTNLLSNMDNAFRRRFTYVVSIPMPDAALRLRIWQKAFPPEAPLAPDVDFAGLARKLELSASAIKTAALEAAYQAAASGGTICFSHLASAIRAEMNKQGTRLSEAEITQMRTLN